MLLGILFALTTAGASEPQSVADLSAMKCQKEFQAFVKSKSWDSEKIRPHVADSYKQTAYRSLSQNIGQWIDIKLEDKKSPDIFHLNDSVITHYSFNSTCSLVTKNEEWPWHLQKIFTVKTSEDWSNDDLRKSVAAGKKGMIYYWSPRFSYSVFDLPRMARLAKKWGYEFTAVVDPRASQLEVQGALEVMLKKNSKPDKLNRALASKSYFNRNVSTDLYMRSGLNHFPVTYIYNKQKIHPRWIVGIMNDKGAQNMADTFANELAGK